MILYRLIDLLEPTVSIAFLSIIQQDQRVPLILAELVRLCCHATTMSYDGAPLECIQVWKRIK